MKRPATSPLAPSSTGKDTSLFSKAVRDLCGVSNLKDVLHEGLGALVLSTSLHMAVGGSREAVYASTAALHTSAVVWVEVAVCTYRTALLNCRRARGHDSAQLAK